MAFNIARYFEATGAFETARRELDDVCSKAMQQTRAPLVVEITPATFEALQVNTFESIVQHMKVLFIEEFKRMSQNVPPAKD